MNFPLKPMYFPDADGGGGNASNLKTGEELSSHNPTLFEHSGMFQSMKQFLPKEEVVTEPEVNPSKPGEEPATGNLEGDLDKLEKPALIEEIKKNQRFVTERDTALTELRTKLAEAEAKAQSGGDPELAKLFEELSVDFKGAYDKIKREGKFKLPDAEAIVAQLTGGDITSRIKQWQDSHLRSAIEKKFNLAEGEFEYDPKDAEIAGTPSWEWKDQTERKRNELSSAQSASQVAEQENLKRVEKQQSEDKKWIADTYFEGKAEDVEGILKQMNETVAKVASGQEQADKHPLAMRNLIRGFLHEQLVDKAVKSAVDNLMAEFAKHKLYLPDKSKQPTNLSNLKGSAGSGDVESFSKEALANSPMLRSMQF